MDSPATIAAMDMVEKRMKALIEGNSKSAVKSEDRPGKRKREEEEDKLEEKLAKLTAEVSILKEEQQKIVECSICKMLPREGPVPCCPRGHFVCSPCLKKWRESQDKKDRCPTCRSPMGTGTSLLAITVIKNALHKCTAAKTCTARQRPPWSRSSNTKRRIVSFGLYFVLAANVERLSASTR